MASLHLVELPEQLDASVVPETNYFPDERGSVQHLMETLPEDRSPIIRVATNGSTTVASPAKNSTPTT